MSHNFIFNATFYAFLNDLDRDILTKAQEEGCLHCGGKLHRSDYPRSPMGVRAEHRHYYERRFSLCCNDCRKRTTPSSVRFFGRRWYPAPLFMLICILNLGINERRLKAINRHFGIVVSKTTWKRWRRWWRERFITTRFWQQNKGLLSPKAHQGYCPRNLFKLFSGTLQEKLTVLLQFLSPMTAGIFHAV
jgi:hypothetical protein